jgi:four helix bundle protein
MGMKELLFFAKLTTMPNSTRFEDLFVWQEAIKLAKEIFVLFEDIRCFSVKNQIERASISVSANIAEGNEHGTNKQFVKHLFIAKASCGEVRSLLILAKELNLVLATKIDPLVDSSGKLSIMIHKLIKSRS